MLKFITMKFKNISPPVFFPDATQAVLKSLDSCDIKNTHTPGILVNTWHLWSKLGPQILKKHGGVKKFMNWNGGGHLWLWRFSSHVPCQKNLTLFSLQNYL